MGMESLVHSDEKGRQCPDGGGPWLGWDDGALAPDVITIGVISAQAGRQLCSKLTGKVTIGTVSKW